MYVCMYVYGCVCVFECVCTCVCPCMHVYTRVHKCANVYTHTYPDLITTQPHLSPSFCAPPVSAHKTKTLFLNVCGGEHVQGHRLPEPSVWVWGGGGRPCQLSFVPFVHSECSVFPSLSHATS